MSVTTIKLDTKTKGILDTFKEYKNESYDEVVNKIVQIAASVEKEPELSKETLKRIAAARKRMREGRFITHEEMKRRLGL